MLGPGGGAGAHEAQEKNAARGPLPLPGFSEWQHTIGWRSTERRQGTSTRCRRPTPKGSHPRRDLRPPARKSAIPLPAHAIPSAIGLSGTQVDNTTPRTRHSVSHRATGRARSHRTPASAHNQPIHRPRVRPPKPKVKGALGWGNFVLVTSKWEVKIMRPVLFCFSHQKSSY